MAKIEVEHRGILTKKKFDELNLFLKKNGKFSEKKNRFSVIYFSRGKATFNIGKISKSPIDLRVRITNKKSELVLKYGKSSGVDARKEFSFPLNVSQFEEAIEFLFILGFYYGALQVTTSLLYTYKGVEIVLVKVPKFGYYFEAEALVEKRFVTSANKKISLVCQELGLNILSDKDFWKLLQNLNNRPGFRFNFKKQKFSDIKKRFKEYF